MLPPAPPERPETPEPLVLRPSSGWRVTAGFSLIVLVWVLTVLLCLLSDPGALRYFLPMAISCSSLFISLVGVLPRLSGETVVDGSGVTSRNGRTADHRPWDRVARISYAQSAFGCRLMLFEASGKRVPLAGPVAGVFTRTRKLRALLEPLAARAGADRDRVISTPITSGARAAAVTLNGLVLFAMLLIAAFAVFLTPPWAQRWWPGQDVASALPSACSVVDESTVRRLVPQATAKDGGQLPDARIKSCEWEARESVPQIDVRLELQEPESFGLQGPGARAHELFLPRADRDCPTRLRDVGDEACSGVESRPDEPERAQVVARKGNVILTVMFTTDHPSQQVLPETVQLTRQALAKIPFE
jgi:hypothetical protein